MKGTNLPYICGNSRSQTISNHIGYIALPGTDEDYFPVEVMNYKLEGSFSWNVNLILGEEKGYIYGASTGFSGWKISGTFTGYLIILKIYFNF